MYDAAYHLNSDPFRLSPDHHFCFRHKSYAKNKAYLDYALDRGEGFVMITGTPGSGKTTLLNDVLANANKTNRVTARIVTTQLSAEDLLKMVAYSFKLNIEGLDKATTLHHLERFLIEQYRLQRKALLVIDEAQDLDRTALEEIRLLTNLQVDNHPLLQVFLVGQENLQEIIQDPRMEQLHQRLIASSHLNPMSVEETAIYVIHRLRTAGWQHDPLISRGALRRIHIFSRGIPRRINQLCSRLLLYGAVEDKHKLDSNDVQEVINELRNEHLAPLGDSDSLGESPDEFNLITEIESLDRLDKEFLDSRGDSNEQGYNEAIHQNLTHPEVSPSPDSNNSTSGKIIDITNIGNNTEILTPAEYHFPTILKPVESDDPVHEYYTPREIDNEQVASDRDSRQNEKQQSYQQTISLLLGDNYEQRFYAITGFAMALLLGAIIWASPEEPAAQSTSPPKSEVLQKNTTSNKAVLVKQQKKTDATSIQHDIEQKLIEHALVFEKPTQGTIKLQLNMDAQFSRGSAIMSPGLQSILIDLAKSTYNQQQAIIHVIGHCDHTGSQVRNISLSKLRAKVVANFLVLQGIPRHRLTTEGRGTNDLISSTNPQLNRRVDLLIETIIPSSAS